MSGAQDFQLHPWISGSKQPHYGKLGVQPFIYCSWPHVYITAPPAGTSCFWRVWEDNDEQSVIIRKDVSIAQLSGMRGELLTVDYIVHQSGELSLWPNISWKQLREGGYFSPWSHDPVHLEIISSQWDLLTKEKHSPCGQPESRKSVTQKRTQDFWGGSEGKGVLAAKPENLSSTPGIHMMAKENGLWRYAH